MRKLLILGALALSGCANAGGAVNSVGNTLCKGRLVAEAALNISLTRAYLEPDPVRREAEIAAIKIALAAFEKCPE